MTRHRQTIPPTLAPDDPQLKAAIRRAWAGETAPPELRTHVREALANDTSESESGEPGPPAEEPVVRRPPQAFWRRPLGYGMAAAAAIAIGAGIAVVQMSRPAGSVEAVAQQPSTVGSPEHAPVLVASLPTELGEQLARSHNACIRYHTPDHHLFKQAPKDNYKAIAQGLSVALNHPVIAVPMGTEWDFHGASICPVGKLKSGHLKFANGDAVVSIYSLPASANSACPEHQSCEGMVKGEPMAGFAEGGAFYCVVASTGGKTPVDLGQVRAIRDRLRGDVVARASRNSDVAMLIR